MFKKQCESKLKHSHTVFSLTQIKLLSPDIDTSKKYNSLKLKLAYSTMMCNVQCNVFMFHSANSRSDSTEKTIKNIPNCKKTKKSKKQHDSIIIYTKSIATALTLFIEYYVWVIIADYF